MAKFNWFYPTSTAEAVTLLQQKNHIPVGGGTELIHRSLQNVEGLICLKGLGLDHVSVKGGAVRIGCMATYADVLRGLGKADPEHILGISLRHASNTPCRNRITVGGSIAFIPRWSDLIGPLLALDAKVLLEGRNKGEYPIGEFLSGRKLREHSLITEVIFPHRDHRGAHYREVRTASDMPLFTVTVLLETDAALIRKARIIVAGTAGRVTRLKEAERYLEGKNTDAAGDPAVKELADLHFSGSRSKDAAYLREKARIVTARTVRAAAGDRE